MASNAFVVSYYGGDGSFIEALVLGRSLEKVGSESDRVVLIRPGLDESRRKALALFFKVIEIDPFPLQGNEMAENTLARFYGVYDKLYAWSLTQYEKVAIIDADTLAFNNPDSIFCFPTPAGCFFKPPFIWRSGEKITAADIRCGIIDKGPGFFNAGVFLIKPSATVLDCMRADLRRMADSTKYSLEFPEQEFIREYFLNEWFTLPAYYNFSPNNYLWGIPNSLWGKPGADISVDDHLIFHYFGIFKPLQLLFYPESVRQFLLAYGKLTEAAERVFCLSTATKLLPTLRDNRVCRFTGIIGEWLSVYKELIQHPLIGSLVDNLKPEPYYSESEREIQIGLAIEKRKVKQNKKNSSNGIQQQRPPARRRLRFF